MPNQQEKKLKIRSKKIRILAIETSCDETAISVIEATGQLPVGRQSFKAPKFKVLASAVSSQIKLHATWGGVVPNLAKREHEKNFTPLLKQVLREAKLLSPSKALNSPKGDPRGTPRVTLCKLSEKYLVREPELAKQLLPFLSSIKPPKIDAIAVTYGPGLEPALWVGINATRALSAAWGLPIVPTNHMEGHIYSTLIGASSAKSANKKTEINFPALALLISGGHTELVLIKDYLKYKVIGATRDDAVGEAFDKVARILGLPYPGGPEISKLAAIAQQKNPQGSPSGIPEGDPWGKTIKLPRPMINSGDFDFSFSGLKTSVLYKVRDLEKSGPLTIETKSLFAKEFQDAAIEVLTKKTFAAAKKFKVKSIIIGGGVTANSALRQAFTESLNPPHSTPQGSISGPLKVKPVPTGIKLLIPEINLTGDNATMIAAAAALHIWSGQKLSDHKKQITARGDLPLS